MMINIIENEANDVGLVKLNDDFVNELKEYVKNSNFNKKNYREKMYKLYDDIDRIEPLDNMINDIIYFDDYEENGIILNKNNISLKQIWTEYRLIYNEIISNGDRKMINSIVLDNFDEIYESVSKKVNGIDKYINELNIIKNEIDSDTIKLRNSREQLEIDKINFENYRKEEIARLEKMDNELKSKIEKINKLISLFEEKIDYLIKD